MIYWVAVALAAAAVTIWLWLRRGNGASAAASTAVHKKAVFPNGWTMYFFNKGEADYLYEEIIEEDTYALLAEDSFVGALPEAPVVFDVGANMGMFSVAVLKRYPQARLFAFEPIPALHAICSKNVQLHSSACGSAVTGTGVGSIGSSGGKDENVGDSAAATTQARCYRMGLSDKRGSANFDFYPHFSLWTHTHDGAAMGDARQTRLQQDVPAMIRDAQGTGKLPAWTRACPSSLLVCLGRRLVRFLGGGRINVQCELGVMSDIIRNEGVKRVDLLKVDVEGCEFQVLQGVDEAHWPLINNVSLEVETFEDVQRVTALLEAKGFQVRSRASEREKVPEVTSEVSHVWARRNRKL